MDTITTNTAEASRSGNEENFSFSPSPFSSPLVVLPYLNGEEDELFFSVGVTLDDSVRELAYARWLITEEVQKMKGKRLKGESDSDLSSHSPEEDTRSSVTPSQSQGCSSVCRPCINEREGECCGIPTPPYLAWNINLHPRAPMKHSSRKSIVLVNAIGEERCRERHSLDVNTTEHRVRNSITPPQRKRLRDDPEEKAVSGNERISCTTASSSRLSSSSFVELERDRNEAIAFETLLSSLLWCSEGGAASFFNPNNTETEKNLQQRYLPSPLFFFSNKGDVALQHLQRLQERIVILKWMISTMEDVRWKEQQDFLKEISRIRVTEGVARNTVNQLKKKCGAVTHA